VRLCAGDLSVTVDAEDGARLTSLRSRDDELLVTDGQRPWHTDGFVMAPWAGRIRDAVARWDGTERDLTVTDAPHALHGVVHDRPWTPVAASDDGTSAAWRREISADEWFAPLVVTSRVSLTPDALDLELIAEAPRAPAPATIGWHPWFRRQVAGRPLTLGLPPAACLLRDQAGIATTTRAPVPDGPLDDALVDLAGPVELRWEDHLAVTVSSDAPVTVIFTAHPQGVCVEPQSGPPNEVNTGPRVVFPGHPLRLHARVQISRPAPNPEGRS
jgi:aldose 1-epimerase